MEPTPARLFPLYDLLSQGAVAFNFNPLDTEVFFIFERCTSPAEVGYLRLDACLDFLNGWKGLASRY